MYAIRLHGTKMTRDESSLMEASLFDVPWFCVPKECRQAVWLCDLCRLMHDLKQDVCHPIPLLVVPKYLLRTGPHPP